jgi:signal transduction histidine kinase
MSSDLEMAGKLVRSKLAVTLFCVGSALVAQDHYLDLGGNVHFLWGTFLAWIWARIFGTSVGILSALACSAWTITLWGHPYGAISTGLEMPVVLGLAMIANTRAPRLADLVRRPTGILIYWILIGMPLVFLSYHYLLELPLSAATTVAIKQAVNGGANMYLAEGVVVLLHLFSNQFRKSQQRRVSTSAMLIYGGGSLVGFSVYYFVWLFSSVTEVNQNDALLKRLHQASHSLESKLNSADRVGLHAIESIAGGQDLGGIQDVVAILENTASHGWIAKTSFTEIAEINAALGSGKRLVAIRGTTYLITVRDRIAAVSIVGSFEDIEFIFLTEQELQLKLSSSSVLKTSIDLGRLYRQINGMQNSEMKDELLGKDWYATRLISQPNIFSIPFQPSSILVSASWSFQLQLMLALATDMIAAISLFTLIGYKLTSQSRFIREEISEPGKHGSSQLKQERFLTIEASDSFNALKSARADLDQLYNMAILEARALVQLTNEVSVFLVKIVGGKIVLKNRRFEIGLGNHYERTILSQLVRKHQNGPGRWKFNLQSNVGENIRVITWDVTCTDEAHGSFTATGIDVTNEHERLLKAARESKLASIGTLAAGFAHEINQPLNIIAMANENLARTLRQLGIDPVVIDKTTRINKQVHRASSFVQNLRRLAKQSEDVSLGNSSFNLSETLLATVELLRSQYALDGIELDAEVVPGLYARGAETLFDQVMINLLTNARDAVSARREIFKLGQIKVRSGLHDDHIWIEVSDDGGGIPEDKLDRIFEPFFTTKETGSGLGLALSKQIIEVMAGSISATNSDVGAKFLVKLVASEEMSGSGKMNT